MKLQTLLLFLSPKKNKKRFPIRTSFTYRKLLNKLNEMSDDELDAPAFVCKSDVIYRIKDLISCDKDFDICNTGDFYFTIE